MQDMLKKIISVDKKAKETVEEAKREQENVEKKLYETRINLKKEYDEKADEIIRDLTENTRSRFSAQEEEIREEFETRMRTLDERFSAFSAQWAEEIAKRAIEN